LALDVVVSPDQARRRIADDGLGASSVEFLILGPLEARRYGEPLDLRGAKQRALLAVLLLSANKVVAVERLIDELWGEAPPERATNAVQVYVSQLRKILEPGVSGAERTLQTRPPGYVARVGEDQLDLHRFERLLVEGAGCSHSSCRSSSEAARRSPRPCGRSQRTVQSAW
jgi:two-component SAPR family response regulator